MKFYSFDFFSNHQKNVQTIPNSLTKQKHAAGLIQPASSSLLLSALGEKEKIEITNIRIERGDILRFFRYLKNENIVNNLMPPNLTTQMKGTNSFKHTNYQSSLKKKIDNLNSPLYIKNVECVVKNFSTKNSPGPDVR